MYLYLSGHHGINYACWGCSIAVTRQVITIKNFDSSVDLCIDQSLFLEGHHRLINSLP